MFWYISKILSGETIKEQKLRKMVAIYIMRNAMQLMTTTIYPGSVKLVSENQMFEELEIPTRSSRVCELKIGWKLILISSY